MKRAGRLYAHAELDHARLLEMLAESGLNFLMMCDRSAEALSLAREHGFHAAQVVMNNTHHDLLLELIITPQPEFLFAKTLHC